MSKTTSISEYSTIIMNNLYGPPPDGGGPPPPPPGGSSTTTVITDLQRNLALYGYILLFLFGFFGHINSIRIFLHHTLRSISTSSLFICVTISDIIYLLVSIDDFLYTGVGLKLVQKETDSYLADTLCRFRSFIQSIVMCLSAWLF